MSLANAQGEVVTERRTVHLQIEEMHCAGCANRVKHAPEAVRGVRAADVDVQGGKATLACDAPAPDFGVRTDAVAQAGYTARPWPPSAAAPAADAALSDEGAREAVRESPTLDAGTAEEVCDLAIEGMACASCVSTAESALRQVAAVRHAGSVATDSLLLHRASRAAAKHGVKEARSI